MGAIWASSSEDDSQPGQACSPDGQQLRHKRATVDNKIERVTFSFLAPSLQIYRALYNSPLSPNYAAITSDHYYPAYAVTSNI